MLHEIRIPFFGFDIPVYGFGLMLIAAFLAAIFVGKWLARHNGINPEAVSNAALIALITGLIGARLCHVLENLPDYTRRDLSVWRNFLNMINIREGGLTFYGGLLLATPCCILYAWFARIPIRRGMDIIAPVLMIGLGIGRVGCFLNGCCYGEQCGNWGVRFPYYSEAYIDQFSRHQITPPSILLRSTPIGPWPVSPDSREFQATPALQQAARQARALPVQPTELYTTFMALLLAAMLIAYSTLPHIEGRVFAMMLFCEGISRFILELIRVEPAVWPHPGSLTSGFSISMILGLALALAGALMWFALPPPRANSSPH